MPSTTSRFSETPAYPQGRTVQQISAKCLHQIVSAEGNSSSDWVGAIGYKLHNENFLVLCHPHASLPTEIAGVSFTYLPVRGELTLTSTP
jgi:hypothetical protein